MALRFIRGFTSADINDYLVEWINELNESSEVVRKRSFSRADRAVLRRCRTAMEVGMTSTFHRFWHQIMAIDPSLRIGTDRFALIAGILSHLDEGEDSVSIAARMGSPRDEGGDRAVIHDLRFRQLLKVSDPFALYSPLTRMLRQIDRCGHAPNLAYSIAYWNDRTKNDWALDYYSQINNQSDVAK